MDEKAVEYLECRFKYFREKSDEELKELAESLYNEMKEDEQLLYDSKVSSFQKTDVMNDIQYAKERLTYIEYLLDERSAKKTR